MFNQKFNAMRTPFSEDQFLAVFEKYNTTVFPAQIILLIAGMAALVLLHSRIRNRSRIIAGLVSVIWLWNAFIYQAVFFSSVNRAAFGFSALMAIEAILLLYVSVIKNRLVFYIGRSARHYAGYLLVLYGLFIYPVIDLLSGHDLSHIISVGLPCPTTIMTFGFFLLTAGKFPRYLLIIPSLWALLGISAAMNFGIYQDFVMVLAAVIAVLFMGSRHAGIRVEMPGAGDPSRSF